VAHRGDAHVAHDRAGACEELRSVSRAPIGIAGPGGAHG
jgi:hypothetical protein